MTYGNIISLLEQYWDGKASDAQELAIRDWYAENAGQPMPEEVAVYAPYFAALDATPATSPLDDAFDARLLAALDTSRPVRRLPLYQRWQSWAVAASIALVVGWSIGYWSPRGGASQADEYVAWETLSPDEQQAYRETRAALLFVSSHLNRGTRIVQEQMQHVNDAAAKALENPDEYQVEF